MQTFWPCSEWTLWRLVCYGLWKHLNYSGMTWTIHFTGTHQAWQNYRFADLIVKLSKTLYGEKKHPNIFPLLARGSNLEVSKNFRKWWYGIDFMWASRQPQKRLLFESSMLSSSSILACFSKLQRFRDITQMLITWCFSNSAKPISVN